MSYSAYGLQNLFSLACRERCMTNLRNIRVPKPGKLPQATAAVLVPMCKVNDAASLLYTVRSSSLRSNSGQVAFPGGKTDTNETPIETALRETEEEIGLSPARVDVWGQGPTVPGRDFKIMITPVVGCIGDLREDDLRINVNEVMEVFTVPLDILCDTKNQFYTQFKNGFILPVYVADEYKIWGITAYITHIFLSSLLSKDVYKNEWMKKKILVNDL